MEDRTLKLTSKYQACLNKYFFKFNISNYQASDFIYQQYVQCEYCLRKFKPQVAQQHIPNCKNIFNRPKPPKKQQEKENEGKKQLERISNKLKIRMESTEKEEQNKNLFYQNSDKLTTKEKLFQINDSFDKSISQIKEIEIFQINPQNLSKKQPNQKYPSKIKLKHIDRKLSFFDQSLSSYSLYNDSEKINLQNQSLKALNNVEILELNRNKSVCNQIYDVSLFGCDHLESNESQNKVLNHSSSSSTQLPSIQDKRNINKSTQLQGKQNILVRKKLNFINKEIKENQGGCLSYENVINRSKNYSQVSCPYCERIFSKNAAPRHIPICKNILNKPAHPLKKQNKNLLIKQNQNNLIQNRSSSSQLQTLIKQNSSYGKIYNINFEPKEKSKSNNSISEQLSSPLLQNQSINCFCTQCGSQLFYSFKYCSSCGKKRS